MLQTNPTSSSKVADLHPGDRLIRVDSADREAEFTVLTVVTRENGEGETVSSLVLRQREGWTLVVGSNALSGPNPRFLIPGAPARAVA